MGRDKCLHCRRGITLMETAITLAVVVLLCLVLMPMLESTRSQMRGQSSAANLMAMGQGGGMYAQDNQGRLFSYSWRAGETYVLPDGRTYTPADDTEAAIRQNIEVLQRITGRINGATKISRSPFIPHRRFLHLILIDYLNQPLGDVRYIDPADKNQLSWADHPLEYGPGSGLPYADGVPGDGYDDDQDWTDRAVRQRWAFASSYQSVPSSWQFETGQVRYVPVSGTPHLFSVINGDREGLNLHTGRHMNEVRFPGSKVWFFEEFDRETINTPYFAYNQARPEKLIFDGSVDRRMTGDALPSLIPELRYPEPWTQTYVPLDTFPLPIGGLGSSFEMNQRYRWSTLGLFGVDYGPMDAPRGPSVKRLGP